MKPVLALSVGVLSLASAACDPPAEHPPVGVVTSALDDPELDPEFALKGAIRVGTCGAEPGTTVLRSISTARLNYRDTRTPTTIIGVPVLTQDELATTEARDASYTMPLARYYNELPATLIGYESWNVPRSNRAVEIYFCGNATEPAQCNANIRTVRRRMPSFTAPETGDANQDFIEDQLTSLIVEITTVAPLPGDDPDDIVSININASNGGSSVNQRISGFATALIATGSDPAAANGFLKSTDANGVQTVRAELLLQQTVADYNVSINVQFSDGLTVDLPGQTIAAASVTPCGALTLDVVAARPPQTITGNVWFRSSDGPGVGPRAINYTRDFESVNPSTGGVATVVGWSSGGSPIKTATSGEQAETYTLRGVPTGRYRLASRTGNQGTGASLREFGGADLTWLDGRPNPAALYPSTFSSFQAMYRWPYLTHGSGEMAPLDLAVTQADHLATYNNQGYNLDGFFFVTDLETEVLDRVADMAYVDGTLTLVGCVDNADISAGAAEVYGSAGGTGTPFIDETGATRSAHTGTVGGFARGLFEANTGRYEIAASRGPWVEHKYRLKLNRPAGASPAYDGTLTIRPSQSDVYTLTPGRDQVSEAEPDLYATGHVTLVMKVRNGDGTLRPFYRPRLAIGEDTANEVPFTEPGTNAVVGTYSATSIGPNVALTVHPIEIVGLTNSTVTIQPSAMVPPNADGSGTPQLLPGAPFEITFEGACNDICVVDGVQYADDGSAPNVSAPSVVSLAFGDTQATVTVVVTDAVPVTEVTIDGLPMTLVPGSSPAQYTATIPVAATATAVTIVATDICAKTRNVSIRVEHGAELCADAVLDQCMDEAPGSVFYVDVVSPAGAPCQLRCEIPATGSTLTCDTTPICN